MKRPTMGMAASQGRLLFMTARLSNNEFEQQCVAYSKQRLADDSQEANDRYLEALQATQYQVLAGYNGDSPYYEPVTYNQLTALNAVAAGKQYVVSDNKNQVVVTKKIAEAFDNTYIDAKGKVHHTNYDFNTFLKNVGNLTQVEKANVTEADVHDAWDKYFVSINRGHEDGIYYDGSSKIQEKHILGFSFGSDNDVSYATYNAAYFYGASGNQIFLQESFDENGALSFYYDNIPVEVESYIDDDGETAYRARYMYPEYLVSGSGKINMMDDSGYVYLNNVTVIPNTSDASKYSFKYAGSEEPVDALYVDQDMGSNSTEPVLSKDATKHYSGTPIENVGTIFYEGSTSEQRELYDYAMAVTEKYATGNKLEYDADKVKYYRNIYEQMTTNGYTTFEKMVDEQYINTMTYDMGSGQPVGVDDETKAFASDSWLINLIKNGKLTIAYYDATEQDFVKTTLDDDESIVEKENKSKIAIAEQVYQTHMDRIEREDKQFDMQLTKLESEHTALTTEYESVAKVISKNVEKSFNVFNA